MPVSGHFSRDELLTSHCLLCLSRAGRHFHGQLGALFRRPIRRATRGRHVWHGVRRVVEYRTYGDWSPAGARQRTGSHRGNFTTRASAASHIYHRNVDWRLMARLGITGVLGAILGAWILSNVEVTSARRFVYAYLLVMGFYILWKSTRIAVESRKPAGWMALLGFGASGGGGWDQ
jgi:hypothetical protein